MAAKTNEPGVGTFTFLLAAELAWAIFWPPKGELLGFVLSAMFLLTACWFVVELPRLYRIVSRDEEDAVQQQQQEGQPPAPPAA